ncbi:SurA N-terminal domain-containing protein [Labrys portucalensis]|uniref:Parvulin-like PPIase n=1 Tax=Labrys neptuniae TaxID=376174 RepID=A0ABV3PGC8_9HYPH|nr:SurA N-terminal domain-containing protein [Labrys neptuniae]MDT3377626.1 SurA N-terminal domain-containing protein [Labrys neptuniae]
MLSSFREVMTKGPAKIITAGVMFLLSGSFALWGVEGWLQGRSNSDVATVGGSAISANTYSEAYRSRTLQITRATGKAVTPDIARTFGIDKQVLNGLISEKAMDVQAAKLGLGLDPQAMVRTVMNDPDFQVSVPGKPPVFDANAFRQMLENNGMNEEMFFARQREVYVRGQIDQGLTAGGPVPQALLQAAARYEQEKRNTSYFVLPQSSVGDIAPPDAAKLQAYYDENKAAFRTKELRSLSYILVTPAELSGRATVTDADVQAAVDKDKAGSAALEQRTVEQIAFPSLDEAKAAAARIASGQITFEGLVTERKLKPEDIDLGTVSKRQLSDQKIADAAFALKEGGTSDAVQGNLANVIVKVTKIIDAKIVLRGELERQRASEAAKNLRDAIEDERMGGAPLKDIAAKLKLKAVTLPPVDAQGRDAEGKPVAVPLATQVLPALFTAEPGSDPEAVDGRDEGLMWFSLDSVVPARDRTLDEAKNEVITSWTADQKVAKLKEKADELVTQLQGGKSLEDIAKSLNLQVTPAWDLTRNGQSQPVPPAVVTAVFATPLKGFGTALAANGTDRIIFHVEDNVIPELDAKAPQTEALSKQLATGISQDLMTEYVKKVEDQLGVAINQTNVDRVVGTGSL